MGVRGAIGAAVAIFAGAVAGTWPIAPAAIEEALGRLDGERVETVLAGAGPWGPVLIVGLMTAAVVASPIPSAPIAPAARAAHGQVRGTVLVVTGAESGALIAFGLARGLGHDALRRVSGDRVDAGLMGSQAARTATVFARRLMPCVSFDMTSCAAGLSRLHAWRFALATLAGILPASFLLAHVGGEAVSGDLGRTTWAALGLGLLTGLPLLWAAPRRKTERDR